MIPTTVAGLVLFIALLTPGYVWVRATERRVFRPSRSVVLEVAEIVTFGVIFSGAALLLLLAIAEWTGIPLPTAATLARSGGAYLRTNPWASLLSLFALIAVGSGLAALMAWVVYRKSQSSISHAST